MFDIYREIFRISWVLSDNLSDSKNKPIVYSQKKSVVLSVCTVSALAIIFVFYKYFLNIDFPEKKFLQDKKSYNFERQILIILNKILDISQLQESLNAHRENLIEIIFHTIMNSNLKKDIVNTSLENTKNNFITNSIAQIWPEYQDHCSTLPQQNSFKQTLNHDLEIILSEIFDATVKEICYPDFLSRYLISVYKKFQKTQLKIILKNWDKSVETVNDFIDTLSDINDCSDVFPDELYKSVNSILLEYFLNNSQNPHIVDSLIIRLSLSIQNAIADMLEIGENYMVLAQICDQMSKDFFQLINSYKTL